MLSRTNGHIRAPTNSSGNTDPPESSESCETKHDANEFTTQTALSSTCVRCDAGDNAPRIKSATSTSRKRRADRSPTKSPKRRNPSKRHDLRHHNRQFAMVVPHRTPQIPSGSFDDDLQAAGPQRLSEPQRGHWHPRIRPHHLKRSSPSSARLHTSLISGATVRVNGAQSVLRGVSSFVVYGPVITLKIIHDAIIELLFAERQLDIHPCRRTDHSQVNARSNTPTKRLTYLAISCLIFGPRLLWETKGVRKHDWVWILQSSNCEEKRTRNK